MAWVGPCPPRDRARDCYVGEVGQLQTCENACKKGTLPTWPTLFVLWWGSKTRRHPTKAGDGLGGTFALPEIGQEVIALAKLANFKPAKMPVKRELCQLGQLCSCSGGARRLDATLPKQTISWVGPLRSQRSGKRLLRWRSTKELNSC